MSLREDAAKRRDWFYETQLRRINTASFRDIVADSADPRRGFMSTEFRAPKPLGASQPPPVQVHLDSGKPIWTRDDKTRRQKLDAFLGRIGGWLDNVEPTELVKKLKGVRAAFEASRFASEMDTGGDLRETFPRELPPFEGVGRAISRAEVAAAKPWLIPELYNTWDKNTLISEHYVGGLERFVAGYENERLLRRGKAAGTSLGLDLAIPGMYQSFIGLLQTAESTAPTEDVRVNLVDKQGPGGKYRYEPMIETVGYGLGSIGPFPFSESVKYWMGVVFHSLREVTALKPDSDMGLCQLVRLLYRYGALPESLGPIEKLTWRKREPPGPLFDQYFDLRAGWMTDEGLVGRMRAAQAKLRAILQSSFEHPRSSAPTFSPLVTEILKHGLTSYKFWLDEPLRAYENGTLNSVRLGLGIKDEDDKEMEYWSENHYIMFASSEYLLGQLWPDAGFQPGQAYDPGAKLGPMKGTRRRERGRARVLKWLNNRIQFGWTEFNSSGYYREHLWALLNLVDFALDEEVQEKAKIVTDLLLFDVVRYLHRGTTMGAPGGRSQFKSKNCGWDNALADVIEMMIGAHGIFSDENSQIGASFASSSYMVPEVLLEIGAAPPAGPTVDRSRVSITFDEAPKHGIYTSMKTDARDSVWDGYKPKRDKHFKFRQDVNDEIARTHNGYGAFEDDTVFFWSMSAYFNKEIVVKSMELVKAFGVQESDAFSKFRVLMRALDYAYRAGRGAIGGVIAGLPGAVVGMLTPEVFGEDMDETVAEDMATFTDGSTRSRANILAYRTPEAMLASVQNFRPGQLNFQSNVNQATLNTALSVFTTSGFKGLDISHVTAGLGGAALGLAVGGPFGAVVGGVAGMIVNEAAVKDMPLGNEGDGPSWWTGYWALPMVAQAGSAAIVMYNYNDLQEHLAEIGSHVWFPKAGFDSVVERRTRAYDNADFFLLDIGDIGPKGFWLFGRIIHPVPEGSTQEAQEAYLGVFSNQRPEWLDRKFELFERRVEEASDDDPKEPWQKSYPDYFADRDWFVDDKNVWIMQVGSKAEFGSFDNFMDRVSSARVHLDDAGDLECTYDIPKPGGGYDRLSVAYGDRRIELNGAPLETDLYPRFENGFVRGGCVEWGQRTYCLEWNGKALLHDLSDFGKPVRTEDVKAGPDDAETIRALVIHLRTGDEEMEESTTATATVHIGCAEVAKDEVVAAGPVGEDTRHDAEWIFFDRPVKRHPDMSFTLHHTGSDDWKASFTLKALMGDHLLRECTLSQSAMYFEDEHRTSSAMPFTVPLRRWAAWEPVPDGKQATAWLIARHPPVERGWQEFHDLIVLDDRRELWHRRLVCAGGAWESLGANESRPQSWAAVTDAYRSVGLFAVSGGRLLVRWRTDGRGWDSGWTQILAGAAAVTAEPSADAFGGVDLCVAGTDGHVYTHQAWRPGAVGEWDRHEGTGFTAAQEAGGTLLALGADGAVWTRVILFGWRRLTPDWLRARRFEAVADPDGTVRVACVAQAGDVWIGVIPPGGEPEWRFVNGAPMSPDTRLCWAAPVPGEWRLFASDVDGVVRGAEPGTAPLWKAIGEGTAETLPAGNLFATSRARGQLEIYAQAKDLALTRVWWA